jgi:hypothetical protein
VRMAATAAIAFMIPSFGPVGREGKWKFVQLKTESAFGQGARDAARAFTGGHGEIAVFGCEDIEIIDDFGAGGHRLAI